MRGTLNQIVMKLMDKPVQREIRKEIKRITGYAKLSYAQEGEDMILSRVFDSQKNGFYVDVGALHPMRYSNTYMFYLKGWRGINIDAMPGSMAEFQKIRSKDINIECPISDEEEEMDFFVFNEPALNTLSEQIAKSRDGKNGFKIINTIKIKPRNLSDVLDEFLPKDTPIDFLSVDVEGLDLKVLKTNDWMKYRPRVVLTEDLYRDLNTILTGELYEFMKSKGYKPWARTFNTVFYVDQEKPFSNI